MKSNVLDKIDYTSASDTENKLLARLRNYEPKRRFSEQTPPVSQTPSFSKLVDDGYGSQSEKNIISLEKLKSERRNKKSHTIIGSDNPLLKVQGYKSEKEPDSDADKPKSEGRNYFKGYLVDEDTDVDDKKFEQMFPLGMSSTEGDDKFSEAMQKLSKVFAAPDDVEKSQQQFQRKRDAQLRDDLSKSTSGLDLRQYLAKKATLYGSDLDSKKSKYDTASDDSDSNWEKVAPHIQSKIQRSVSFASPIKSVDDKEDEDFIGELGISLDNVTVSDLINDSKQSKSGASNTLTEEQWRDLIVRLNKPYDRKEKKIQQIKEQREADFHKQYKFQPWITTKSKKMASGNASLPNRVESILEERNSKIEEMKEQLLSRTQTEKPTFQPAINKSSKKMIRTVQSFFVWNEEKRRKQEMKKKEQCELETGSCAFRPEISKRTEKIMNRKKRMGIKSVWDRNYEYEFHKLEKIHSQIEAIVKEDRTPAITNKAQKLERDEPVGDRLYRMAMSSIHRKQKAAEEQFDKYYHNPFTPRKIARTKQPATPFPLDYQDSDPEYEASDEDDEGENGIDLDQIRSLISQFENPAPLPAVSPASNASTHISTPVLTLQQPHDDHNVQPRAIRQEAEQEDLTVSALEEPAPEVAAQPSTTTPEPLPQQEVDMNDGRVDFRDVPPEQEQAPESPDNAATFSRIRETLMRYHKFKSTTKEDPTTRVVIPTKTLS